MDSFKKQENDENCKFSYVFLQPSDDMMRRAPTRSDEPRMGPADQ